MTSASSFSLRRQLLVWLLVPQLVLWLMGGVLAFRVALSYAERTIDQSLTQSVRSLSRQVKPLGSGLLVDFPRAAQDILEQDPTDRVSYMVSSPPGSFLLGNNRLPEPPSSLLIPENEPVLYNLVLDGKSMRVASIDVGFGVFHPSGFGFRWPRAWWSSNALHANWCATCCFHCCCWVPC
jgi:two-component system, OmpR family, sensor histidine kinase TctE